MADFNLSQSVTVDVSQAVPALDKAAAGVAKLTDAARATVPATTAATAAEQARGQGLDEAATKLPKLAAAELNLSKIRQAIELQAKAQYREEIKRANDVASANASAMKIQAMGAQQLGMQFGDLAQQVSLGINPFVAFGQQAQQGAFAMSQMGGKMETVGKFLMGPWGIAMTVGITVLGNLASQLIFAGKEADNLKDKQADLADYFDRTTGAVRAQITQLQLLAAARGKATDIKALRETIADSRGDVANDLLDFTLKNQGAKTGDDLPAIRAARAKFAGGGSGAELVKTLQDLSKGNPAIAALTERVITSAAAIDGLTNDVKVADAAMKVFNGTATTQEKILAGVTSAQSLAGDAAERVTAKQNDAAGAAARHSIEMRRLTAEVARTGDTAALERGIAAANAKRDAEIKAYGDSRTAGRAARREEERETKARIKEIESIAEAGNRAMLALTKSANDEDFGKIVRDGLAAQAKGNDHEELFPRLRELTADSIGDGAAQGWKRFRDDGHVAINAIARQIGGQLGGAIGDLASLGSSRGRGGSALGAIVAGLTMIGPSEAQKRQGGYGERWKEDGPTKGFGALFGDSFKDRLNEPFKALGDKVSELFSGPKGGKFAENAGKAFAGAAQGSISSGVAGALGIKQSGMGAQLGGAIGGAFFGPFGGMIGGLLGGTLGGLLGGTKKASTTVSASGGSVNVGDAVGNSAGMKKASEAMGNSIGDAIEALVSQLGGDLGDFSVSIGQRKSKFVVDPSGQGRTKGGGVQKFKDESEAVQAALADAIRDGAVAGVSPRVQSVLNTYADNLNKAVAESMKVKGLEDLLANDKNPFATLFRDFDLQAKQRSDAARKYGFDLVEIERITGEQRAQLIEETLQRSTASVRALLDDLKFGSRAEGSFDDRRASLAAERDRLVGLARAGDQAAGDKAASVIQQLIDLDKQGYGSTARYAASRSESIDLLNELVRITEDRIKAAQQPARETDATTAQLSEANGSLDDIVGLQQRMLTAIEKLPAEIAALGGGGDRAALGGYVRNA